MHLIDFFDHGLQLNPHAECVVEGSERMSYEQVSGWSHCIALGLRNAGIKEQDRVAILSPNNLWGYVSMLGLQRARCIWVVLNARSSVDDTITHLQRARASWIFYHSEFEADLPRILAGAPNLRGATCVDKEDGLHPGLSAWAQAYAGQSFPLPEKDDREAIFRIASSGGTTGAPKAVMHTQIGIEANVAAFTAITPHEGLPRYLLAIPMTHAGGSASFHVLARGGSVHILHKPDLALMIQTIETEKITIMMLTPTTVYSMLALPDIRKHDFSSLRYLLFGAAPMSAEKLKEAIDVFGPVMLQIYGQTEAATVLTAMLPSDYALIDSDPALAHRLHSCGRPTPFARLAIMDEAGKVLGPGERGELVVRSGMVMRGYWEEEVPDTSVNKYGWHHTSDIAYRDEDGFFYIVDRIRDLIITGGFNVFPSETEQVIWSHPAVRECAVIGVPDKKWGEAVKAVIELKPGATVDPEEIIALCKAKLGSVKAPKTVEIWDELPRSPIGKVLKKNIRERFWTKS
jgi:acyl-CoA synthetase (AMP-forming)/AMP-acid ligase II